MNYIKKLEAQNDSLLNQIAEAQDSLTELLKYLSGPKFQGPDNDYVNANEMRTKLRDLRNELNPIIII